jgi:anti-sigma regulatory factor (Ser/Thr protein kinase)
VIYPNGPAFGDRPIGEECPGYCAESGRRRKLAVDTNIRVEPRDHVVQFYERDQDLVDTVSAYLAEAVRHEEVAVAVATRDHVIKFEDAMASTGIDLAAARASGRLITLGAGATLARFLIDGLPDADTFDAEIGGVIRGAAETRRPVRVYGEMVTLLWNAGLVTAAIELETLWNELGREVPFSLFCSYPRQSVSGDHHADAFLDVCHLHSGVVGAAEAEVTLTLPPALNSPGAARRLVAETLEQWGRYDLIDDTVLIVTELVTNAVIHAQSDVTIAMSVRGGTVRIAVRDSSPEPPVPRHAIALATSGRGLALVAAAAGHWETEVDGYGKVVWVELRR